MPSLAQLYQIADFSEAHERFPMPINELKKHWPALQFSIAYEEEMDEITPLHESERYLWYAYVQGGAHGCGRLTQDTQNATGILLVIKEIERVAERSVA